MYERQTMIDGHVQLERDDIAVHGGDLSGVEGQGAVGSDLDDDRLGEGSADEGEGSEDGGETHCEERWGRLTG